MIIDFHTHTFPGELAPRVMSKLSTSANIHYYTDATNEGLLSSMKKSGIDLSIILPIVTKPSQFNTINDTARKINEQFAKPNVGPSLLSFGSIHPDTPEYRARLTELKNAGIRGIKLHPVYQDTDIDDIRFMRIIDCASELGLTTIMHAGEDLSYAGDRCSPAKTRHMIDTVHPLKFVAAHMGGIKHVAEVEKYLIGCDIYLDTSFVATPVRYLNPAAGKTSETFLDQETFRRLVYAHGTDKIVFATDSPWSDQEETLSVVRKAIDEKDYKAIFEENARKLL